MRLRNLDEATWARIARDIEELADEIAFDPHPDIPVEDYPDAPEDEWPDGLIAIEVWRDLNRSATLAHFASVAPRGRMDALRLAMEPKENHP